MKWLRLFKRKRTSAEAYDSECSEHSSSSAESKAIIPDAPTDSFPCEERDVACEPRTSRSSLESWLEARKNRISIDRHATTTTEKLTISKAGHTTVINKTYIVVKHLGTGMYGQVKLCLNIRDNKLYAVKACRKSQLTQHHLHRLNSAKARRSGLSSSPHAACSAAAAQYSTQAEEFVKEVAILKKLQHKNIVGLLEVINDPSAAYLLLVMEYVEGDSLQQKQVSLEPSWETLPEEEVWRYVRDFLQGIDYLHYHSVVHGDLKPANVMLDSTTGTVKIVDFSSAITHDHTSPAWLGAAACSMACTPAFRSPESLAAQYKLGYQLDMWALGVCIYMWVFGRMPFPGSTPSAVYDCIRSQPLLLPATPRVSAALHDLLARLLDKDPTTRLDVVGAMNHPWVTEQGTQPMTSLHRCGSARPARLLRSVTQDEMDDAISEEEGSASQLMGSVFEEVHFAHKELLIQPGDLADKVYLVTAGQVEIFTDRSTPVALNPDAHIIRNVADLDHLEHDDDEFLGVIAQRNVADCFRPGDASLLAAYESRSGSSQVTIAVKGPGDSLGLTSLAPASASPLCIQPAWNVSVCARGAVTVLVAPVSRLRQIVASHPHVEAAVKQIAGQQETDMMVAEAMRQLHLVTDLQPPRKQPPQQPGPVPVC